LIIFVRQRMTAGFFKKIPIRIPVVKTAIFVH
jgi:hypothetical protein